MEEIENSGEILSLDDTEEVVLRRSRAGLFIFLFVHRRTLLGVPIGTSR
jgi:hypothetical protein